MDIFPKTVACGYVTLTLNRVRALQGEVVATYTLKPSQDEKYIAAISAVRRNFGVVQTPMTAFRTRLRLHPKLEGVLFQCGINRKYATGLHQLNKNLSTELLSSRRICFLFRSHMALSVIHDH